MQNLPERFLSKVVSTNANECWNWMAAKNRAGYGRYRVQSGLVVLAHRYALESTVGPIGSLVVDHLCFNPSCVNPQHLRAITNKQNGEHRRGANPNSATGIRGVTWRSDVNKWQVSVTHLRHRYHGGYFGDLGRAESAAKQLRNKLFTHDDAEPRAARKPHDQPWSGV